MRVLSWLYRRQPVEVIAVDEEPLGLADLHHPDVARRQAAERAWLAEHHAHRAGVAGG